MTRAQFEKATTQMMRWGDGADVRVHLSNGEAIVGYDLVELTAEDDKDELGDIVLLMIEGTEGKPFTEALIAIDHIVAIEQCKK